LIPRSSVWAVVGQFCANWAVMGSGFVTGSCLPASRGFALAVLRQS
jgi:hypothetical protein